LISLNLAATAGSDQGLIPGPSFEIKDEAGNDSYFVDNGGDKVFENANEVAMLCSPP
jgi:hypothetical protein